MITADQIKMELSARERSKGDLLLFTKYTKPDFIINWHHVVLADKLQKFANKEIKNLAVFLPPQVGKSELCSRRLPAYVFGTNPNAKIILAAYNKTFASLFNKDIQRIINSERYKNIFPNTKLNIKNITSDTGDNWIKNSTLFEIIDHTGFLLSTGIGGALTGLPADLGIIDDPIKGIAEAESKTYRESLWDWYINVFKTRLHNDSQQLITLTRWHEDDLAGRILDKESHRWEILQLPALNEDGPSTDDPRQPGEALWPAKHSAENMREIEKDTPRTFRSLYQQEPTDKGGNIFKRADFEIVPLSEVPEGVFEQRTDVTADTAYTKDQDNDPSGCMAFTEFENDLWIYNWTPARLEFSELCKFVFEYRKKYGNRKSITWVEPKASGKSVVQYLKKKTDMNIVEYLMPEGDKVARSWANEPYVQGKRVKLIKGAWNKPFLDEVCIFPRGTHDEAVDNLNMAITQALVRNKFKQKRSGRSGGSSKRKVVIINSN